MAFAIFMLMEFFMVTIFAKEKLMFTRQDEYDCHVVARVFAKLINSLRTTGVQQILAHLCQK